MLLVFPAAACRRDGSEAPPGNFTAEEVNRHFSDETNDSLGVDASESTTKVLVLRLSEPALDSPLAMSKYGDFAIFVVNPAEPDVTRLLAQQIGVQNGLNPDRRGIIWRRTPTGWAALKRYGRNVVLGWDEASEQGSTDQRWAGLDDALAGLDR
jgi:hypothetical protein